MKTSEVFALAKRHLASSSEAIYDGKERFICHAIGRTRRRSVKAPVLWEDIGRCQWIIMERLDGYSSVEGWLKNMGRIDSTNEHLPNTRDAVQKHRHAWLNLLIKEFKAKGD